MEQALPDRPVPADGALPAAPGQPRLQRRRSTRVVAGVAGGVADHLGVQVLWVRVAFAVLAGLGGAGVVAYALLWIFAPQESPTTAARSTDAKERQQAFALIALGIGLTIGISMLAGTVSGWLAWPLAACLAGAAVVWREADEAQRRRWSSETRSGMRGLLLGGGTRAVLRIAAGILLVVAGIGVFLLHSANLDQVQFALVAVFAALLGVAVLTVPWWVRLMRDLGEERRARIRTDERAEIAAHLHDSVLQTLALIQKQPEASREVLRLARSQERQLRSWLYGPGGYGRSGNRTAHGGDVTANGADVTDGDAGTVAIASASATLSAAIGAASGDVEDTFAIKVQHVVVGDCPMNAKLTALVQAAREAMVNAAKHAKVTEISVYAEVENERVAVYVRDRGAGFDPDAVGADRHGLADSIHGRMERNGGEVRLRTAIGEGTEVQLSMPLRAASTS